MPKVNLVKEYQRMPDFGVTSEPNGNAPKKSYKPIFVVQEHHASRPHYDFRLVAQIAFAELTEDGKLRHSRIVGNRRDKEPGDVVREIPGA